MSKYELITLIISGCAFIVSALVGINQLLHKRKNIKLLINYKVFENTADLIINNNSQRPILIKEISMNLGPRQGDEPVPRNAMFTDQIYFPIKIASFDSVTFRISDVVSKEFIENDNQINLFVFDADGKKYSRYSVQHTNTKWGYIETL